MKKWVENTSALLFWIFAVILSLGLSLGFYYLIFVMAKKVFFG